MRPGKDQLRADVEKGLHYLEFTARPWPRVSPVRFLEGLSPNVSVHMVDAARCILLMSGSNEAAMWRERARDAFHRELRRLDNR